MFNAIKEFFVGKPKPAPEAEVPYKVEVVQVAEISAVVETAPTPVVEIVPAGTEATMAAPAPVKKAPAKPKAPAKKTVAPKAKAPAKPKAPVKPKAPAKKTVTK